MTADERFMRETIEVEKEARQLAVVQVEKNSSSVSEAEGIRASLERSKIAPVCANSLHLIR
jgi:GTP-sensing pleiotropic transcriptional regulator CodY